MNLIGKFVQHKIFGKGEIIEDRLNILVIKFEGKTSKFEYPAAFNNFLKFEDVEMQKIAETKIAQIKIIEEDKRIIDPLPPDVETIKLVRNLFKGYGTRAQEIYEDCCKKFGWDYSQRGFFAPKKPLYAYNATPEGYSVIFLAHSNWTETKAKNKINIIKEKTLEERWNVIDDNAFYTDKYIRVAFAKSKQRGYVFLGVYRYKETKTESFPGEKTQHVKIYERISDVYSLN